jgi:hypothetical protein
MEPQFWVPTLLIIAQVMDVDQIGARDNTSPLSIPTKDRRL